MFVSIAVVLLGREIIDWMLRSPLGVAWLASKSAADSAILVDRYAFWWDPSDLRRAKLKMQVWRKVGNAQLAEAQTMGAEAKDKLAKTRARAAEARSKGAEPLVKEEEEAASEWEAAASSCAGAIRNWEEALKKIEDREAEIAAVEAATKQTPASKHD